MHNMKLSRLAFLTPLLLSSCGNLNSEESNFNFANHGFESGDLTNWTAEGSAFDDVSVQIADSSARKRRIIGSFYLDSSTHGNGQTGRLNSEKFIVTGNGKIGILIGGVRDQLLCYIALVDASTDNELLRITNQHFNHDVPIRTLYRHTMHADAYLGREVYLSIIDNDSSSQEGSYILVDDIQQNFSGPNDIGTLIQDARDYTNIYKNEVGSIYRHQYHLMPTIGWMNDPNGLVYHDGKYHIFYQHNPYSTNWDTMHWGHAISEDLIRWEDAGVALAPDTLIDKLGVYSGGAISDHDGNLHLIYTTVGEGGIQQQAIATSFDGMNFSKRKANPIIDSSMRMGSRITDFRDPYIYKIDNTYYAMIGGKLENPGGQLLLYKSTDLLSWKPVGVSYASSLTNTGMFECPNVISIEGKDVIITSPQAIRDQDKANYQNIHSVTYQIGKIDYSNGLFINDNGADYMKELDKGFDFYATQAIEKNGQHIMLAWMNMWSRNYPSAIEGWVGAVTLPRQLTLKDNHLYQQPIQAITNYYTNQIIQENIELSNQTQKLDFDGNVMTFKAELDVSELGNGKAGFEVFKGTNQATKVYYDGALGMVVFDRRNSGVRIDSTDDDGELNVRYASVEKEENNRIFLEFFLDVSSVEVFINHGYYTMSGVVYPDQTSQDVNFFVDGGRATLVEVIHHDIEVSS